MHKFYRNIFSCARLIKNCSKFEMPLTTDHCLTTCVNKNNVNFNICTRTRSYCSVQNDNTNQNQTIQAEKPVENSAKSTVKLTEEEEKKLKVLKLEYDVFYSTGVRVPSNVTDNQWLDLLRNHPSVSSRKKFYAHLFCVEKARQNKKEKVKANLALQMEKKLAIMEKQKEGLLENFKNTYMLFVQEKTMNTFYYNNIFRAMIYGPHLVFDFGFDEHLTEREIKDLMKQIYTSHGINKIAKEPFHFHFCNLSPTSNSYQKLIKTMPNIDEMPITISEQSYLNFYPKDKLVYLSPNASEVMTNFDFDVTYIIGGIVDKAVETPLTMAKAKREKIRMMKFPLDKYVKWVSGSKALSLNHVVGVLTNLKSNNNWTEAFTKCLPPRKFISISEEEAMLKEKQKFNKNSTPKKVDSKKSIVRQMKLPVYTTTTNQR